MSVWLLFAGLGACWVWWKAMTAGLADGQAAAPPVEAWIVQTPAEAAAEPASALKRKPGKH